MSWSYSLEVVVVAEVEEEEEVMGQLEGAEVQWLAKAQACGGTLTCR